MVRLLLLHQSARSVSFLRDILNSASFPIAVHRITVFLTVPCDCTNSMEQRVFTDVFSFSPFMDSTASLQCAQGPIPYPCPQPAELIQLPHIQCSLFSTLILFYHRRLFTKLSLLITFWTKTFLTFVCCVLRGMYSTIYVIPQYALSFTLL